MVFLGPVSSSVEPIKVVVVSNSIDFSPDLIEYLQQEYEVISIAAEEYSQYQDYEYYVILGGPDAPEGIGDLVSSVLSFQQEEYLRVTGEYNIFIRIKDGKTFFILAGSDRDQTRLAVTELKDEVMAYLPKKPIVWLENFDDALEKAKSENKLVYVDFVTDWCFYCKKMDEETYTDPRIIGLLTEKYVAVKIDKENPENKDVVMQYKILAQPEEIVVTPDGTLLWSFRGFLDADDLYTHLTSLL
jgi:thiol-disulfide isomerase/thioredoxin